MLQASWSARALGTPPTPSLKRPKPSTPKHWHPLRSERASPTPTTQAMRTSTWTTEPLGRSRHRLCRRLSTLFTPRRCRHSATIRTGTPCLDRKRHWHRGSVTCKEPRATELWCDSVTLPRSLGFNGTTDSSTTASLPGGRHSGLRGPSTFTPSSSVPSPFTDPARTGRIPNQWRTLKPSEGASSSSPGGRSRCYTRSEWLRATEPLRLSSLTNLTDVPMRPSGRLVSPAQARRWVRAGALKILRGCGRMRRSLR